MRGSDDDQKECNPTFAALSSAYRVCIKVVHGPMNSSLTMTVYMARNSSLGMGRDFGAEVYN